MLFPPGKGVPPPPWEGIAPCLGRGYPHLGRGYPSPHLGRGYPSLHLEGVLSPTWERGTPSPVDVNRQTPMKTVPAFVLRTRAVKRETKKLQNELMAKLLTFYEGKICWCKITTGWVLQELEKYYGTRRRNVPWYSITHKSWERRSSDILTFLHL